MMFIEIILGTVSVLLVWLYIIFKSKRPKNYPPGPIRLPLIGNLHNLSNEPAKDLMGMRKKFGDIIAVDLGPYPAVVLNSFSAIKEALSDNKFAGRPVFAPLNDRSFGKPGGVVFQTGIHWVEQRRFLLKNLRDFGFGKKSMEGLIQEEITELIETFKKSAEAGTPVVTQNKFNAAVLNAIWALVGGQRYSHSDPILVALIEQLTSSVLHSQALELTFFFPFLKKILSNSIVGGIAVKERRERFKKTTEFLKSTVKAHQESYQENAPRDFIDVYLNEIAMTDNPSSSFFKFEGERNLLVVMKDLFEAGAETTSTTLSWEFLLLAMHVKVQDKLFHEVKLVVGLSRLPSLSDRPFMPYTEAVIMEVMRFGSILPISVLHRTTESVFIRGFLIPKDTLVIPNLYCVHHDELIWGDPENFRPERFLNEDETKVVRREELIPFSIGKRACLGESLARDELFLFTSSLFQRFRVLPHPMSPPLLKIDYHSGPILVPKPYPLILHERFIEK